MAKINPNRAIQRHRTADEMRTALTHLVNNEEKRTMPPQIDDDDIILADAIAELLEARQTIEQIRGFAQQVKQVLR